MGITCCYRCEGRQLGCHDVCSSYQEAKERHEHEKEQRRRILSIGKDADSVLISQVQKRGKQRRL